LQQAWRDGVGEHQSKQPFAMIAFSGDPTPVDAAFYL
jgi:hypothetical protein